MSKIEGTFRIHFDSWVWFVGLVITLLGVPIIYCAGYRHGQKHGREATIQTLLEIATDKIRDNEENHV